MTDPELAGDLPERSKSQGISEVEDGTLVIRAKFKAKAGKQLMIRRAALTAVHRAFQENGIRAVPKPLTSVHCSASHLITPARSTSFNRHAQDGVSGLLTQFIAVRFRNPKTNWADHG